MIRPGNLYVFLHGLWVVSEGVGGLEIALPSVPDHVYKAGSWLAETPIAPNGTVQLTGVATTGAGTFAPKAGVPAGSNLMVSLRGCALTSQGRAATLLLPRPNTIHQLLRATVPTQLPAAVRATLPGPALPPLPSYVVKRVDTGETWDALATVQVLVYDYSDENQVALDGHYWEPCTTQAAISLHIISTSEGPISLTHEAETTKALKEVIAGYPQLDFTKPIFPPAWVDNNDANFGDLTPLASTGNQFIVAPGNKFAFSQAELEYPSARRMRLGRLGRIKQQGRRIEGLWREGDPLDDRLSNCQGLHIP